MNLIARLKQADHGMVVLVIIFLVAFPVLFKPWIHGADTIGYYSWLRSLVIDGDLQTADEFEHFGMGWLNTYADTGLRDNPGAVGSAVLWSPWFLAAHGLTLLGRALGLPWAADGYGQQHILAISLGSAVYAFVALLLAYRLARNFFALPMAALAVAAVCLASPLVFYMYSHPLMSHANDTFAYALFLLTWHRTRKQRSVAQYGLLGLTAALCALVRNQNAVLVVFPLLEIAFHFAALRDRLVERLGRRGCFRPAVFHQYDTRFRTGAGGVADYLAKTHPPALAHRCLCLFRRLERTVHRALCLGRHPPLRPRATCRTDRLPVHRTASLPRPHHPDSADAFLRRPNGKGGNKRAESTSGTSRDRFFSCPGPWWRQVAQ
ncbi:MAG: glycosyltransferase family 39 protein [Anaerolineae bacterium]